MISKSPFPLLVAYPSVRAFLTSDRSRSYSLAAARIASGSPLSHSRVSSTKRDLRIAGIFFALNAYTWTPGTPDVASLESAQGCALPSSSVFSGNGCNSDNRPSNAAPRKNTSDSGLRDALKTHKTLFGNGVTADLLRTKSTNPL